MIYVNFYGKKIEKKNKLMAYKLIQGKKYGNFGPILKKV